MTGGTTAWERTLVARIAAGDDTALATAYDQYAAGVFGIAARMLGRDQASDVVQEVFAALWDRPERFDADRGSLRTFLCVLARRRCIDALRMSGRRAANERRAGCQLAPAVPNVDEAAIARAAAERVRAAMSCLPTEQRTALELAYFSGLTFRQVAAETGTTEGTAKSRIRLGLRRLSTALHASEDVEWA